MRLVFTKVPYFRGGDLVTWGLEEPVSHVGIEFSNGEILHSSFRTNVEFTSREKFFKDRVEVLSIDIPGKDTIPYCVAKYKLKTRKWSYDFRYLFFLVKEVLFLKLFRNKISYDVRWESTDSIICHEILEFTELKCPNFDNEGANTPFRLYKKLREEGF